MKNLRGTSDNLRPLSRPALALLLAAALLLPSACAHRQQPKTISRSIYSPQPAPAPAGPAAPSGATVYVGVPRLNLRSCPATNCQIVSTLNQGQTLTVLGQQEGWIQVQVPASGQSGWVGSRYVTGQTGVMPSGPGKALDLAPVAPTTTPAEEWAEPAAEAPAPPMTPLPPQEEFVPVAPK